MKNRNARRAGSSFPKMRDSEYRAWIRSLGCEVEGQDMVERLSVNDVEMRYRNRTEWRHVCWGRVECAHVNETQARGAADVGECVPLCTAAHFALDQRLGPATFAKVTGLNLTHIAAGLAQCYVERGGWVDRGGAP
jgi:hypothetical protein